jgi:hypothetical protein
LLGISDPFLRWIWKITGGNAEVFENTGVVKKAIRKLKKTKSRFCTRQQQAMRDDRLAIAWGAEIEMSARVPPLRSASPRNRADE